MVNTLAIIFGVIYLLVGVGGLMLMPGGGVLLGIFAVNTFHHLFHITSGGLGLVAGWIGRGRLYCQVAGVVFSLLGILGLLAPALMGTMLAHSTANLMTDNLLHLMTGIGLSYFGFLPRPKSRL
jgi:hypothetical protein